MELLTDQQIELLKSKHVSNVIFKVGEFTFNCLEGEWLVTKGGEHIDVFTFRLMSDEELHQTLYDIFYNTDKLKFE